MVEDSFRSVDSLEHDGSVRRELFGEVVEDGEGVVVVDISEVGRRERGVVGRSWNAGWVVKDEAGDSSRETRVDGDFLLEKIKEGKGKRQFQQARLETKKAEREERT